MFNKSLVAMLLLAPVAALAQVAPGQAASNKAGPAPATPAQSATSSGSGIDCTRWHKTPNGDWRPAPGTVVSFDGKSLAITRTISDGDASIDGKDVYMMVDESCGD